MFRKKPKKPPPAKIIVELKGPSTFEGLPLTYGFIEMISLYDH